MDRYEIMLIVKNTIEEEKVKKIADSLKDLITNDKGNIIDFKEMGKRKLAYPIKKEVTGTYYVMTVEANHDTIKERLLARGNEHQNILDQYEWIDDQFKFYAENFHVPVIDTTKMTLTEIFNLVEEK